MANDNWLTPRYIFDDIQHKMGITFTLDPCTSKDNPLNLPTFFTKDDDGLTQSWADHTVFMNPPYSRKIIDQWVKKAKTEARGALVVGLLPLRVAKWFRKYILKDGYILHHLEDWTKINYGDQGIYFYDTRVRFINPDTGKKADTSPTWDTVIVVWV